MPYTTARMIAADNMEMAAAFISSCRALLLISYP